MSDRPADWDRTRDEIISGEYVLGVLSEEDRRIVEARMATDPKFARQVQRWQTNLAGFNEDYGVEKPPAEIYSRIEARLFGEPAPAHRPSFSLWNSVSFWRGLAAAAVLGVIGISLVARFDHLVPQTASRPLVAELTGMDSPISLVASYDFGSGKLSIIPAAMQDAAQPRSLELWLIEGEKPPLSLGVLPESGEGDIVVDAGLRSHFAEGRTIAITVEPLGGAPDGKPTGPVIALGKARFL